MLMYGLCLTSLPVLPSVMESTMQIVHWTRYLSYVTFCLSRVFQLQLQFMVFSRRLDCLNFLPERAGNVLFASQGSYKGGCSSLAGWLRFAEPIPGVWEIVTLLKLVELVTKIEKWPSRDRG